MAIPTCVGPGAVVVKKRMSPGDEILRLDRFPDPILLPHFTWQAEAVLREHELREPAAVEPCSNRCRHRDTARRAARVRCPSAHSRQHQNRWTRDDRRGGEPGGAGAVSGAAAAADPPGTGKGFGTAPVEAHAAEQAQRASAQIMSARSGNGVQWGPW